MKRFLLKFVLLIIPAPLFYMGLFYCGYLPIISNSVSFDAKVLEARRLKGDIDILTIGSSVALNDISSEVMTDSLHLSYYNMGAWGIKIEDLDNGLLKAYADIYHPRYIILASNFSDFESLPNPSFPDLQVCRRFLPFYYLKNMTGFNALAERRKELNAYKNNIHGFSYLNFDKNGGVALTVDKKFADDGRKHFLDSLIKVFPDKETPGSYRSLSSIAGYLKSHHIRLIFVQTPFTSTYVKSAEKQNVMATHLSRCRQIVEMNGGLYIDIARRKPCPDSLFADDLHLSGKGATVLTQQLIKDLKTAIGSKI